VVMDREGNIYVADDSSNPSVVTPTGNSQGGRILKVTDGRITRIAGVASVDFYCGCYPNGRADSNPLLLPSGVAMDGGGNFFIVEGWGNNVSEMTAGWTVGLSTGPSVSFGRNA